VVREQVAELDELERDDGFTRDEELVPRLERVRREPVGVDRCRAEALEPGAFDDADTPRPVPSSQRSTSSSVVRSFASKQARGQSRGNQ
jgi:hypothetical protein